MNCWESLEFSNLRFLLQLIKGMCNLWIFVEISTLSSTACMSLRPSGQLGGNVQVFTEFLAYKDCGEKTKENSVLHNI